MFGLMAARTIISLLIWRLLVLVSVFLPLRNLFRVSSGVLWKSTVMLV